MLTRFTLPPSMVAPPPSVIANSASMSAKCSRTMKLMPTPVVSASSPDSARKMTSRSSGTSRRFSISIVMRFAASTGLSSLLPRPQM